MIRCAVDAGGGKLERSGHTIVDAERFFRIAALDGIVLNDLAIGFGETLQFTRTVAELLQQVRSRSAVGLGRPVDSMQPPCTISNAPSFLSVRRPCSHPTVRALLVIEDPEWSVVAGSRRTRSPQTTLLRSAIASHGIAHRLCERDDGGHGFLIDREQRLGEQPLDGHADLRRFQTRAEASCSVSSIAPDGLPAKAVSTLISRGCRLSMREEMSTRSLSVRGMPAVRCRA